MNLVASLLPRGLSLDYSVESEKPSVIGLHYYYRLPASGGKIKAAVEGREDALCFDALQEVDSGFIPKKGPEGFFEVFYENTEFTMKISFKTDDPSWQLYRPQGSSYICIEPLSAKDPKHPIYKKSRLQVKIEILD